MLEKGLKPEMVYSAILDIFYIPCELSMKGNFQVLEMQAKILKIPVKDKQELELYKNERWSRLADPNLEKSHLKMGVGPSPYGLAPTEPKPWI